MPKKGMKRPEWTHTQPHNQVEPVPELQGKAKHGKEKAKPIISGTGGFKSESFPHGEAYPVRRVFHYRHGFGTG